MAVFPDIARSTLVFCRSAGEPVIETRVPLRRLGVLVIFGVLVMRSAASFSNEPADEIRLMRTLSAVATSGTDNLFPGSDSEGAMLETELL